MDNAISPAVCATSPPPAAAGAMAARRPKSAGAFPSAARKLLMPNSTGAPSPFHSVVASPSTPFCTRYQSHARLVARGGAVPSTGAIASPAWTPRQPKTAASTALVVPSQATRPRTASAGIARQVVKEEIELQRQVMQDAQRQLQNVQRELSSREKEIQLLQQQLVKLRGRQQQSLPSMGSPAASFAARYKATSDKTSMTPSTRPQAIIPALRDQLEKQDAYKKRLRHMLDRLARNMQLMVANEELLRQQTACASRERTLFAEKLAQDRNVCRELAAQRARILHQRQVFREDAGHLLETYRDEIAARTEVNAQRQVADRRRRNLLQLMESRPSVSEGTNNASKNCGPESCQAEAVLRRSQVGDLSQKIQVVRRSRRNSCAVLAADASGRRESVFELYEAQYDRILVETGESDVIRVLESFLGFAESQKRLVEIEKELATESERLEQEMQAHAVLLSRLRSSGIAEVEKRKKIRDYLEHIMHERQLEKTLAKETFGEHAKLFLYLQQGVLNVADLVHCLDDRSAASSGALALGSLSASSSAVVGGTRVPVVAGSSSVSDAAYALTSLVHYTLLTLRGQTSVAAALEFSTEQMGQLARFMPDLQIDQLVGSVGVPAKLLVTDNSSLQRDSPDQRRQSTAQDQVDQEEELEQSGVSAERRAIKDLEKSTLKEVEALFRTIDARKQRQAAAAVRTASNNADEDRQNRLLSTALGSLSAVKSRLQPVAVYDMSPSAIQSALASPETEEDMREKLEAVHTFFREKRKHDEESSGHTARINTGGATTVSDGSRGEARPTRPQDASSNALAGEVVKRNLLRRKGSMLPQSIEVEAGISIREPQQAANHQTPSPTTSSATSTATSSQSSGDRRRTSGGGSGVKAIASSPNAKGREIPRRKGSARTIRSNLPR